MELENTLTQTNPLVSIIVITYNSAKFVLETLESAKAQTYQNIELIVSDDCSTDDTVEVCKNWIEEHKNRFVRTELITVEKNTGIPKNCNRGLYAAKGEWVKPIAGDDALMEDCISDYNEFVQTNENISFCFSDMYHYKDNFEDQNLITLSYSYDRIGKTFCELSQEYQQKVIVRRVIINAPTVFCKREKFIAFGGFDEKNRLIEDWPTWHNLIKAGNSFHYLPNKTVMYRVHSKSITKNKDTTKSSISVFAAKEVELIKENFLKYYTFKEKALFRLEYSYQKYYSSRNKKNLIFRIFQRIWYCFVLLSIRERHNALNKYYLEYLKLK